VVSLWTAGDAVIVQIPDLCERDASSSHASNLTAIQAAGPLQVRASTHRHQMLVLGGVGSAMAPGLGGGPTGDSSAAGDALRHTTLPSLNISLRRGWLVKAIAASESSTGLNLDSGRVLGALQLPSSLYHHQHWSL
jgi:hypothetical protein